MGGWRTKETKERGEEFLREGALEVERRQAHRTQGGCHLREEMGRVTTSIG